MKYSKTSEAGIMLCNGNTNKQFQLVRPAGRISLLDDASLATSPALAQPQSSYTLDLGPADLKLPAFSVLRSPPSLGQISVLMNSCTNKLQIAIAKSPLLLHPHNLPST